MILLRYALWAALLALHPRSGRAQAQTMPHQGQPHGRARAGSPRRYPAHVSRFAVLLAGQAHGSRHLFADQTLVSPRLLLRPGLGLAVQLGLRYQLTPQVGLETGLSGRSDEVAIASVADYRGGRRYEAVEVATIRFNSPQLQVGLVYHTRPSPAGHAWTLQGGLDVISRRHLNLGGFGTGLSTNAGQPPATLTASNQPLRGSVWRFGLQGAGGREWQVHPAHSIGLRLVGRVGLQEFSKWQLSYTFTEDGIARRYQNLIHTKLGYVGLQTWYRFHW